jgi:hypothetical protein
MRWLWLVPLAGCADLPELDRGICGNAIVELGEDCDGFESNPLARCLPPGEQGACHFDCAAGSTGTRWACPPGWACDADDLCRQPTGLFEPAVRYAIGGVESLASGDFDGDGRADLLSRNPGDLTGRSRLSFHYFDARAALVDTRAFRKLVMKPAIGNVSSDGLDDLVFSDFRVGLLLGHADRSWVPEVFTPYVLPAGMVRLTGVLEGGVDNAAPLATLATLGEGPGVYSADSMMNQLQLRTPIHSAPDSLLGLPLGVGIVESASSPCDELVLAFRGESALQWIELCAPEQQNGNVSWRPTATNNAIQLVPPAPLDAAPLAADLNRDGHLDVMVGAGGTTYVAFGDGHGLSAATPYQLVSGEQAEPVPNFSMPLAMGDVSGDGVADFVLADRIILSVLPSGASRPVYNTAWANSEGSWTSAKIVDLNGNGFPDVVAAERGRLHVDFYNGSGKPWLRNSKVLSARPISQLGSGDFDGDLINDLALVEQAASPQELDTVKVAFGALAQSPTTPQTVARGRAIKQIGGFRDGATSSMYVVAAPPAIDDQRNLVYLLLGDAERIPFAALELISFTQDGSLGNVISTALVLGAFAGPAAKDALALSIDLSSGTWHFWLVPGMDGALPEPTEVAGALDARLTPSAPAGPNMPFPTVKVYAAGASADLDRDGRDEAIWVMPAEQGTRCGVESFSVTGQLPSLTAVTRGAVLLEGNCVDPQLSAVDADQDGSLDLAVLTGSKQATDRKLYVLWNDGNGHFAADRSTLVNASGDSPQAFTSLRASDAFSFVYATQQAVVQWRYAGMRTFGAPTMLASLRKGTGIVAADLDGDGVTDLALADDGDIRVLKAQVR